jgi:hypothetical protein
MGKDEGRYGRERGVTLLKTRGDEGRLVTAVKVEVESWRMDG